MDWNEHERLFNSIQIHKIQVKEQLFCCCSAFHIQIRVFNNYQHPYPKMYMKRLSPRNWMIFYTSAAKRCILAPLSLWCHFVYINYHIRCGSIKKIKILQIRHQCAPTLHDEVTNTDKKTTTGFPSGKY